MTDDERRMEDMMLGKHIGKDKGTIKFMQKYYHKGAFYMVSRGPRMLNWPRGECTPDDEQIRSILFATFRFGGRGTRLLSFSPK